MWNSSSFQFLLCTLSLWSAIITIVHGQAGITTPTGIPSPTRPFSRAISRESHQKCLRCTLELSRYHASDTLAGQTQRDTKVATLGGYPPSNCEFVRVGKRLHQQPGKPYLGLYLKQRQVTLGTERAMGSPSDTPTITGGWDISDRNYTNYTAVLNETVRAASNNSNMPSHRE